MPKSRTADHRDTRRIAIAGFGAIGAQVAKALSKGIAGCELTAISARNPDRARAAVAHFARPVKVVPIEELEALADVVVECAPADLLSAIVRPFVEAGKMAIVLSAGALLSCEDLIELARQRGGQIVVPTGALLGLDAVTAAMEGTINSVKMITRKPVRGLVGAPYLQTHNINVADIKEPTPDISWQPARSSHRLSRESQRRRRALARRHWPRQDHVGNLGRSKAQPQYSLDRGRRRFRQLLDGHSKRAEPQSENRADNRALGYQLSTQIERAAARRLLMSASIPVDLGLMWRCCPREPHDPSRSLDCDTETRRRMQGHRAGANPRMRTPTSQSARAVDDLF